MTEPDNHLMPSERNAPGWKLVRELITLRSSYECVQIQLRIETANCRLGNCEWDSKIGGLRTANCEPRTPLDLTLPLTFSACFLPSAAHLYLPYSLAFFFSAIGLTALEWLSQVFLGFGLGLGFEVRVRATQCTFFLTCSIIKAPPSHICICFIWHIPYHTILHRLLCGLGFGLEEATNYFSR